MSQIGKSMSQKGMQLFSTVLQCTFINTNSQGENNMAYTANQEAALISAAPITSSIAEAFAAEFGVSKRSVISKAVTLKIYQKDAPRVRATAKPKKADIVAEIGEALNAGDLSGLENATMRSLYALLRSIG